MSRMPFHLTTMSPWPLTGSLGAFILTIGLTSWFYKMSNILTITGIIVILMTMIQWWRDVSREATFIGDHTSNVSKGMRWGMILFITSEIAFFFAFFWTFFHSSLSPTHELGCIWPPYGIIPLNPFAVPLLNTAILLASGVTITWAHHSIMEGKFKSSNKGLVLTILLGFYFTILQLEEYLTSSFSLSDSIYGSTFFVATGFHGLHVIIGTIFLFICYTRLMNHQFSLNHHFGFEAAAWYWHFVDVVWIFLFISIYWWGS